MDRQRGSVILYFVRKRYRSVRAARLSTMALMARLDNAPTIAVHRKLGFRLERRMNEYYDDRAPAWRMRVPFNLTLESDTPRFG
jgi:ribosomal protein S18 acetylase RimI-like enzyme